MATFEEYAQTAWERNRRTVYVIPGQVYINRNTKLWYYCKIHQSPYLQTPHYVCRNDKPSGCPKCSDGKPGKRQRIDDYAQRVWHQHRRTTYVIEGQQYKNAHTKVWHYCLIHQFAYEAEPQHVTSSKGGSCCRICAGNQAKSIEQYSQIIKEKSSRSIYVIPGQKLINFHTKIWYYCTIHKHPFAAKPNNVYTGIRKSGCSKCKTEKQKALKLLITLDFIGNTTVDGHYITEHIGYYRSPKDVKKGLTGSALFKYVCGRCGNKEAVARGSSLKTPGNTQGCEKCHCKRETIHKHRNDKIFANGACKFYIASVYSEKYIKLGISNDYKYRSIQGNYANPYYDIKKTPEENKAMGSIDLSYGKCFYLSENWPRSWVFTAEQILLQASLSYLPKEKLPNEMIEAKWPGQTELRDPSLDLKVIKLGFKRIIQMIISEDKDWHKVYKRQIGKFELVP